tara:strand:+ start:5579 stop:5974 length:396 start_codon:yes stop_codon:yes gene_type:complete
MSNKHACHCQFCDKEMLAENLATKVCGYITCGDHQCQIRAENTTKEFIREEQAKVVHKARMIIFSTKTPEDERTWCLVEQKDHPACLADVHIMGQMEAGHFLHIEDEDLYLCARSVHEVIKEVKKGLADGQ